MAKSPADQHGVWRSGSQSAIGSVRQVREHPQRAARILLDIEAGAPVILIPESSRSPRLIVANLGQLRVRNRFLPAGSLGTFSHKDKVEKLTMAHAFFPSLVSLWPTLCLTCYLPAFFKRLVMPELQTLQSLSRYRAWCGVASLTFIVIYLFIYLTLMLQACAFYLKEPSGL